MQINFENENLKKICPELNVGSGDIDIDTSNHIVKIEDIFNKVVVTIKLLEINPVLDSTKIMIKALKKHIDDCKNFTIILEVNKIASKQDIKLRGEAEDDNGNKYNLIALAPCKVIFEYKKGDEIIYQIK